MDKKVKILVVDDDMDILETIRDVLELEGFDVACVDRGAKALEIANTEIFDVVLMDIKMPVMNGVETFKKLKQIIPGVPVIMVSAYAVEDLIAEALREGAFAALKKPLDFDRLFEVINAARGGSAMVMVVDDEEQTCRAMKSTLDESGYRTTVAYDGESAIEKARANNFDIIILDMKLPTLNGLETYLAIREIRPSSVVIIMTGYTGRMLDLAHQAVEKNAYVCLQKPIDMENLLELIGEIVRRKSAGNISKP